MTEGKIIEALRKSKSYSILDLVKEAKKNFPEILPLHRFEPDEEGFEPRPFMIAKKYADSPLVNDYYVDVKELIKWYKEYLGDK